MDLQIQKIQQVPNRLNNKPIARYIEVKCQKTIDEEKTLKAHRKNNTI